MATNHTETAFCVLKEISAPYLAISLFVSLCILILVVNSLTLVVLATTPQLRTISNMYIASLALADIMVGIMAVVLSMWMHPALHPYFAGSDTLCVFLKFFICVSESSSVLTLILVSVDRFLFIMHPFFYLRVVSKRKVMAALAASWAICTLVGLIFHVFTSNSRIFQGCDINAVAFLSKEMNYLYVIGFAVICVFLSVLYGIIVRAAVRQARAIAESTSMTSEHKSRASKTAKHSVKLLLRMSGVCGTYFVCWWPILLVSAMGPSRVSTDVVVTCLYLGALNSAANFPIYALADPDFRSAVRRLTGFHYTCFVRVGDVENTRSEQ